MWGSLAGRAWTALRLPYPTSEVTSVCATPDGTHALTGSWDKTAWLWSLEDGALVREFKGHDGGVTSVCATPDGKQARTDISMSSAPCSRPRETPTRPTTGV